LDPDGDEAETARELLDIRKPDIVLTGTSMGSFLERHLWREARERNIPSATILDSWIHVAQRFSWGTFRRIAEGSDLPVEIMPNLVFCPDSGVLEEARRTLSGLAECHACGHPWLEWCQSRWIPCPPQGGPTRILFLSEPVAQDYGAGYWGFTEGEVLGSVLSALADLATEKDLELVVRAHPREDRRSLGSLLETGSRGVAWRWAQEGQTLDHASRCHLTCGMTSMALLESWSCGCPTLSLLPNLSRTSPYLPDLMGWDPAVHSHSEIPSRIRHRLAMGPKGIPPGFSHSGAAEKILQRLEAIR
jgi:hypothetical protein